MKAQELRIGNYVYDDQGLVSIISGFKPHDHSVRCDEEEGCVLLIDIFNHGDISKGWETDLYNAKPIPLTEEMILKCGFKEDDLFYHKDDVIISNFYEDYFTLDSYQDSKIRYLHQLQNLYFILTEKELEIKL